MKRERGFTLLELLVVMVIMGLLISMATLNTSYDKRKDLLANEAKRLKFFLEAASDEAMFQNKNIGLMVGRYGFKPYAWLPKSQDATLSSSSDAGTSTHSWQEYQGRFIKGFELPDDMAFELEIDSSPVNLPHSLEGLDPSKQDFTPQLYLLSNGGQSIATFNIFIDEYEPFASVTASGLGRFYFKVNHDEQ